MWSTGTGAVLTIMDTPMTEGTHIPAGFGSQGPGRSPDGRFLFRAVAGGNRSPAVGVDDIGRIFGVFPPRRK